MSSKIKSKVLVIIAAVCIVPQFMVAMQVADTVWTIPLLIDNQDIVFSAGGRQFVCQNPGSLHIVYDIDNPFQISGMIKISDSGTDFEIPVGILSNGEVITETNFVNAQKIQGWTPGNASPNWTAPDDIKKLIIQSGSDVIIGLKYIDSVYTAGLVELYPFRFTPILPASGYYLQIVGKDSYIAFKSDQSVTLYNIKERRIEGVVTIPKTAGLFYGKSDVAVDDRDPNNPVLLTMNTATNAMLRFDVRTGKRLPDWSFSPRRNCELGISYLLNATGDTVVISCVREYSSKGNIRSVFALQGDQYNEIFLIPTYFSKIAWLGNKQFAVYTMDGITVYNIERNDSKVIALYDKSEYKLSSSAKGLLINNVSYYDIEHDTLLRSPKLYFQSVRAQGTDIVAVLDRSGMQARVQLWNFAKATEIKSVPLPYSSQQLKNAIVLALSSDLRYVALSLSVDTIIVQDLSDTTRTLYDVCDGCGKLIMDFSPRTNEMVALGENSGGIWNLDSLKVSFLNPDLTAYQVGRGYPNPFILPNSGDIILKPSSRAILVFDRQSRTIRKTKPFRSVIGQPVVLDDNTIICEIRDTIFIFDSTLTAYSRNTISPHLPIRLVKSWDAKEKLILVHLKDICAMLLRYKPVTSVEESSERECGPQPPARAYWDAFEVEVPTNSSLESIRVFNSNGEDVTQTGIMKSTEGEGTRVVSTNLPTGLYTIVDRSSGWISTVMLMR